MPANTRSRTRNPRARASQPTPNGGCQHCGHAAVSGQIVKVEPVRESVPDVGALRLCGARVRGPERTWRLRYRERT
jgi:hypothetical protein